MIVALTGATGFVGGPLLDRLREAGHTVRALTRRPQPERDGVAWVAGDLADRPALARLAAGADVVIHVAGVLNAPDAAAFEAGNVKGTAALLDAATAAGAKRFVHVSSLAAREPSLSNYGASKARSEAVVAAAALPFIIVRPPAVYGPGDRETLDLFRMAAKGFVLMPPAGRLSLLHVDDLARLLVALADPAAPAGMTLEPDDGSGGLDYRAFSLALATASGRKRVATVQPPPSLIKLAARLDRLLRGGKAKLTPDRASYFCHPDWVADPARAVPSDLWQARIAAADGLAATARWYRSARWL